MTCVTQHKVTVDFIGNDNYAIFFRQAGHSGQRIGIPLDSGRIMRIAKNHHARLLIAEYALEPFKVHTITGASLLITIFFKRIVDHSPSITFGDYAEGMIDRRLDDNAIARSGKEVKSISYATHHSRHKGQFLPAHSQAVATLQPVDDRLPIGVRG